MTAPPLLSNKGPNQKPNQNICNALIKDLFGKGMLEMA